MDGKEHAQHLTKQFESMFDRNGDLSVQKALLNKFINDVIGGESHVARALKAINQAIVAPASIDMRMTLLKGLGFKDAQVRPWEVYVKVGDTAVEITHCRRQCNIDAKAVENAFEFTWELSMLFDRGLSEMVSVNIAISELTFGDKVPEEKRHALEKVVSSIMSSAPAAKESKEVAAERLSKPITRRTSQLAQ